MASLWQPHANAQADGDDVGDVGSEDDDGCDDDADDRVTADDGCDDDDDCAMMIAIYLYVHILKINVVMIW